MKQFCTALLLYDGLRLAHMGKKSKGRLKYWGKVEHVLMSVRGTGRVATDLKANVNVSLP